MCTYKTCVRVKLHTFVLGASRQSLLWLLWNEGSIVVVLNFGSGPAVSGQQWTVRRFRKGSQRKLGPARWAANVDPLDSVLDVVEFPQIDPSYLLLAKER